MHITIYWKTQNQKTISRIREKFNLPSHTTVNGETPCEIREEDLSLLKEVERRGFIQIRNKE